MNEIRERLERREYEVDTKAVAQALLDRLMAGRAVAPAARRRPLV